MKEIFETLGGLRNIKNIANAMLTESDILSLEQQLGARLPNDYRNYLLEFGLKGFNNLLFFKPKSTEAIYMHSSKVGLPNIEFSGSYLDCLYGKLENSPKDIFNNLENFNNRIPDHCLPIGGDGLGNLILIDLSEERYSQILFWDFENEWDEEEYKEETGMDFNNKIKYQNTYLLANNFTDFIASLEVREEE